MRAESPDKPAAVERLPFIVRYVRDEVDLARAVAIRHSAYARHVPELAVQFTVPEASDLDGSSRVLVALARLDGAALGSMRFRTNRYRPLDLEQSVTLPESFGNKLLAEATRLAVSHEAIGRTVKAMLMKAMFLQCEALGVDSIVVAARSPMDRMYEWLLFEDVFAGGAFVPMAHAGMIPHRVMACDVVATKRKWLEVDHPWYSLFFRTHHPDIDVSLAAGRTGFDADADDATVHPTAGR